MLDHYGLVKISLKSVHLLTGRKIYSPLHAHTPFLRSEGSLRFAAFLMFQKRIVRVNRRNQPIELTIVHAVAGHLLATEHSRWPSEGTDNTRVVRFVQLNSASRTP